MKIQTLNNKQQDKLLKLCKEFFPNYKDIYEDNGDILFISHKEQFGFKARTKIHWYQLCLTELPKRIWNKLKDIKRVNNYKHFWFHTTHSTGSYLFEDDKIIVAEMLNSFTLRKTAMMPKHPVDFLYDFVTFCKKNKYFKS